MVVVEDVTDKHYNQQVNELQSFKLKMLASVSHELRTQLNCSIILLQVSQSKVSPEVYQELILPAL